MPKEVEPNHAEELRKKEFVQVEKSEYQELLESKAKLEALEAGGVDNRMGYDIAMEPIE